MAVLLIELNEATEHFVNKLGHAGILPNFRRMLTEGASVRTHIPDVSDKDPRFTRKTSPWIVWPSIYTGMRPDAHELIGFGQDTSHLRGKYLWDVLERSARSYGVFGSLNSYPPRSQACFYLPEALANTADCVPEGLRHFQEFLLLGAHNYSASGLLRFLPAAAHLARSSGTAVSWSTAARAFAQLPLELISGARMRAQRAMLQSYLVADAFERLYKARRPDFATVHFNHVAYYEHRFWRAREPERFLRGLSSTDRRFYRNADERERDEARFAQTIDEAYSWSDSFIGRMMEQLDDGDLLLVASGLGQRPYDPVVSIHNPVVRFEHAERFFERLGLDDVRAHYEMNPDITLDCSRPDRAEACEAVIRDLVWDDGTPLFYCQRRRNQLFLEFDLPARAEHDPAVTIRHRTRPNFIVPGRDHIWQSPNNEQSSGHHDETGLLIAWRKGGSIVAQRSDILITEVAPEILGFFGIGPQTWHADARDPIFDT